MDLEFRADDLGDGTGPAWRDHARAARDTRTAPLWEPPFTPGGEHAARAAFTAHLPELTPVLDRLADGWGGPGAMSMLTHAALRPPLPGCSQAGHSGTLVRNYDLHPHGCSRTVHATRFLRPVIGMGEGVWGLLDGMNDAGLAVSLTYGGRPATGPGASVLLVVRLLLETCTTAAQAWTRLRRIPLATAQNLTLVDADQTITAHLGPDREPVRAPTPATTNHQDPDVDEETEAFTATRRRLHRLESAAAEADHAPDPADHLVAALLEPPLYQRAYDAGLGTLYTAAYRPRHGTVTYHWPRHRWEQSFTRFTPGRRTVAVG